MQITISNFKSIDLIELELSPLTILLGPPACGKSNILDAIALAGYFNRFLLLDIEYGNNASNIEPLTSIARFNEHTQLFKYYDLSKKIKIGMGNKEIQTTIEIFYSKGIPIVQINEVNIPWDLRSLQPNAIRNINNSLKRASNDKSFIEARLYGYDRYGLATHICTSPVNCGFHLHMKNMQTRSFPRNIMSEFGWNTPMIIKSLPDVIIRLNRVMREHLSEEVEILILRTGVATVFDYGYEVEASSVSDTIFRILYYLVAIRSAISYVKLHGLENRFILLLEEPEAHVFPFFLDLLAKYITEATSILYVIVTTHNPLLVSMLWDKIKDVRTYYVFRDHEGSTNALELDIKKLASELTTVEEILFTPPSEVIEKYTVSTAHE